MGLPAVTAGLKRHKSITMEFASRTISPVHDISRYGPGGPRHYLSNHVGNHECRYCACSDLEFFSGPSLRRRGFTAAAYDSETVALLTSSAGESRRRRLGAVTAS